MEISLTDFVEFTGKVGTTRIAAVRLLKNREAEYRPFKDYYKQMREFLQELHQGTASIKSFPTVLSKLKSESKIENYESVFAGHIKYFGRKQFEYVEPPYSRWNETELSVRVNPELGLIMNGKVHIIKLYFKSEPLSKQKTSAITHMMEVSLRDKSPDGAVMAVLDLRRGKLYAQTAPVPDLDVLLSAEAAAFIEMWNGL